MLLDGYIRVSQVAGRSGESFISPLVQREQIEAWATMNNATVGECFEELDESGGRADRPLLLKAIERVEGRQSDGMIVAKLDRFARSVIDGLNAIGRIERAGGIFVSVQDGIDLSTPTGKLILRVLFSMGEWELDRVRANWDIARAKAINRGVHISSVPPYGFLRGVDGRLVPDPGIAPVLAEAYAQRAAGKSVIEVTGFLNRSAISTRSGVPFNVNSVWKSIQNPAYMGEAHSGPYAKPGAHPGIVDIATWHLAQRTLRRPFSNNESFLAGMLRCAGCGRRMCRDLAKSSPLRTASYRCSNSRWPNGDGCSAPARVSVDEIEPLVEELLFKLARRALKPTGDQARTDQALSEVLEAKAELERTRGDADLERQLGRSAYRDELHAQAMRQRRSLLELGKAKRAHEPAGAPIDGLSDAWPEMALGERRDVLADLMDCVVIERGSDAITERAAVCLRGRGPIEVGHREHPRPIKLCQLEAVELREPRRWSAAMVSDGLREFFGDRPDWPHYSEFGNAGRARLHAQVMRWGGPYYWGHFLEVTVPDRFVIWSEKRVHDALRPFLAHRKRWPKNREFREAGLEPLRRAIPSHGGIDHWAAIFGVRSSGRPKKHWTPERVERELREFTAGRQTFPRKDEFVNAGRLGLYMALRSQGGQPHWIRKLGLQPVKRRNGVD